jgi:hypothetical protein
MHAGLIKVNRARMDKVRLAFNTHQALPALLLGAGGEIVYQVPLHGPWGRVRIAGVQCYSPVLIGGQSLPEAVHDGAAVASGAIVDGLIRAKAIAETGVNYKEGWILMTTTTVKVFIDIFIGIWAFVLAIIWCAKIECKPGEKVRAREIWERFPKFVIGYALTFIIFLILCAAAPALIKNARLATAESNGFRQLFFAMTFFTIGVVSNFKKLWEEGIGRLAVVYLVCLFGFIIWVGLAISWIFFHGVKPPIITG